MLSPKIVEGANDLIEKARAALDSGNKDAFAKDAWNLLTFAVSGMDKIIKSDEFEAEADRDEYLAAFACMDHLSGLLCELYRTMN